MRRTSRSKLDRLPRTTAGFTTSALGGNGLRCQLPARLHRRPLHPVLVHRLALLIHASFRPRLTTTPLRFSHPSPPPGWTGDLHPQAVEHVRHTTKKPGRFARLFEGLIDALHH